jgi:hypothetical protein
VGLFVSPGIVGEDVIGDMLGVEVVGIDVGMEVGRANFTYS